jgi:ceramide glucosyltransferase
MAELQQPGVEAVTCLYRARATGNFWARLAALSINADFLPNVVVSLTCHLAQPCLGPTIAIRRQMLKRIGGFSSVSNYLGADYLIGQAARAAGGEVRFAPFVIECACFERSRAELFARQLRAARTVKTIKPWGYAGTVITHPLPLALLAALFNRPTGFLLAAAAISCRMLLYFSIERAFHLARQHYLLIVVHDLIAFAVFVTSYFGQTVIWRDHKYRLTPSLRMVQVNVEADSQDIEGADPAGH